MVKTELIGSSLTGYWVADPVGYLLDSDLLHPATAAFLTHFFGGDNVHFTPLGYTKLVGGLSSAFGNAVKNVQTADNIYQSGLIKLFFCRLCILHSRVGIHESFLSSLHNVFFLLVLPDPKNKGSYQVLHRVINYWFCINASFFLSGKWYFL